jgi:1-acyl-sn-glycerol-3-phosphate acyltransferase
MAKEQVFRHPVSGPLMRGMKHIPVDRAAGAGAYRAALTALRGGELVGVFPEATISQSFCLKEFKTGAVRMAVAAGVPVYPLVLWGSQRVWTKGRPRNLRSARGTPITISLGAPLRLPPGTDATVGTKQVTDAMEVLLVEAQRDYPTDPAGAPWWLPARAGGSAPTPERAAELEREQAAEKLRRTAREG